MLFRQNSQGAWQHSHSDQSAKKICLQPYWTAQHRTAALVSGSWDKQLVTASCPSGRSSAMDHSPTVWWTGEPVRLLPVRVAASGLELRYTISEGMVHSFQNQLWYQCCEIQYYISFLNALLSQALTLMQVKFLTKCIADGTGTIGTTLQSTVGTEFEEGT